MAPENRPLRIFLSSTSRDLAAHRAAVTDILERWQQSATRMETFGALPGTPLAECRRLAAEADALIVVVAHRYGWVPGPEDGGDGETSITLHEVEAARAAGRPIFGYLVDPDAPWDQERDEDPAPLERLRGLINQNIRDLFTTPDDLAKKVSAALGRWLLHKERHPFGADTELALDEGELREEALAPRLGIGHRLTELIGDPGLITRALAGASPPSAEEIDAALAGERVTAAKTELDELREGNDERLAGLESELADRRRERSSLESEIRRIERLPKPQRDDNEEPEAFDRRQEEYRQARRGLEGSKATVAEIEEDEKQLRERIADREEKLAELRRQLEAAVLAARDEDMLSALIALREAAARELDSPATAFRGCVLALATDFAADLLDEHFDDPAVRASTRSIVARNAEALEKWLTELHRPIEEGFLLTAALVRKRLEEHRPALEPLRAELAALPRERIAELLPRARALVDGASAAEAEGLLERSAPLEKSLRESDGRCRELIRDLDRATAPTAGLFRADIEPAWRLLARVGDSAQLGTGAKTFSAWVLENTEQVLGAPPLEVIETAAETAFHVREAERTLAADDATALLEALTRGREARAAAEKKWLAGAVSKLTIPILGPVFARRIQRRLDSLASTLARDEPAYAGLRAAWHARLRLALALTGGLFFIAAVVSLALTLSLSAGGSLPPALVAACVVAGLCAASYLLCAVMVLRTRRRLPPA